jgi:NhaP-type Na+/H+ or K+/H+ antiporter
LISDIDLGSTNAFWAFVDKIPLFIYQLMLGVGVGIIVGLILLKYMRKNYSHQFSPVAVITATLIAYLFAEQMNGNGVLAVAVMSFMFGNVYVKGKPQLEEFSGMLTNALEILVFVLLGIVIKVPLSLVFIIKSLLLFVILIAVRAIAVNISLRKDDYSAKEKLFISLNMPKGIALAAPALLLSTYPYYSLYVTLQLVVMFIIYSMLLSFIIDFYAKKMLSDSKDDKMLSANSHMRIVGPLVSGRGPASERKRGKSSKKAAGKKAAKSSKKRKAIKKAKKASAKKKITKNKAKKTKRKK